MKHCLLYIISLLTLCACTHRAEIICGVPAEGTPWQLAAAIHDSGDGSFLPERVEQYADKAYIIGWSLPAEQPDTIICDLTDGLVSSAILQCKTIGIE